MNVPCKCWKPRVCFLLLKQPIGLLQNQDPYAHTLENNVCFYQKSACRTQNFPNFAQAFSRGFHVIAFISKKIFSCIWIYVSIVYLFVSLYAYILYSVIFHMSNKKIQKHCFNGDTKILVSHYIYEMVSNGGFPIVNLVLARKYQLDISNS